MSSSLVPEKPLLVYPSLAATLGLEESLLLCALSDKVQSMSAQESRGFLWFRLDREHLVELFPFWDLRDIQRVCTSLRDKGVLIISSGSIEHNKEFRFAFNEKAQRQLAESADIKRRPGGAYSTSSSSATNQLSPVKPSHLQSSASSAQNTLGAQAQTYRQPEADSNEHALNPGFLRKNYMSASWQPEATTLGQLAQHRIPSTFAVEQIPEFIAYWRDRGEAHHSWNSKFIQHTLRQWRKYETKRHKQEQEVPIDERWQPSLDALDILIQNAGIKREFIEDAIPEFILYWRERGESHSTWNTKFVQHVRVQWAKYTAAIEHNTDPRPIAPNWKPSEDVNDVLRLANIDITFARSLIPEFVLYWRDRGTLHGSWNTKYLQHVKHRWAQRYVSESASVRPTREISLEEELTDRSWAN